MSAMFEDLMNGLDEVDAFLAGQTAGYKVSVPAEVDVKSIRKGLKMTQSRFTGGIGRVGLVALAALPRTAGEFRERIALGEGDADRLISEAGKELRKATSEPGWRNYWKGEGFTPDFSRLAHYLDRMVELDHADAVVKLSREIMSRGMEIIGQSNDEGETATAIAECLPPLFRAVEKSSLTPTQRLLYAIDADLKNEYNVIESDQLDTVLESGASPEDGRNITPTRALVRLTPVRKCSAI